MEQSDRSSDSGEYDEHIEALAPDEDLFEYYDDDVIFAASDAPDDDASDALQWVVSAHGQEKIQAMKEKMVQQALAEERVAAAAQVISDIIGLLEQEAAHAASLAALQDIISRLELRSQMQSAAAELIQHVWRFRRHIHGQQRVLWLSDGEGCNWVDGLVETCLVEAALWEQRVQDAACCLKGAMRIHLSRSIISTKRHEAACRRSGILLTSHVRKALIRRRLRHLLETLPAMLRRRPFILTQVQRSQTDLFHAMSKITGADRWWLVADAHNVDAHTLQLARDASCRAYAALRRAVLNSEFVRCMTALRLVEREIVQDGAVREMRRLLGAPVQAASDCLSTHAGGAVHRDWYVKRVSATRVLQGWMRSSAVRRVPGQGRDGRVSNEGAGRMSYIGCLVQKAILLQGCARALLRATRLQAQIAALCVQQRRIRQHLQTRRCRKATLLVACCRRKLCSCALQRAFRSARALAAAAARDAREARRQACDKREGNVADAPDVGAAAVAASAARGMVMDHGRVLAGLRASAAAGMGDVIVAMDAAVDAVAVEVTLAMEVSASSSVLGRPPCI